MATAHLASLGARKMPRNDFIARIRELSALDIPAGRWPCDGARQSWESAAPAEH